ncbi:MAG: hypothetical protein KAI57_02060 [Candidatus Pacebacteria bacterium]|nr:hypothetical protein [Candidatus Paceibacterota bacterium]
MSEENIKDFAQRRREDINTQILLKGKGPHPWSSIDLSELAWQEISKEYPNETKHFGLVEAVEEIDYLVISLLAEEKLEIAGWSKGWYGDALLKTKT